MVSKKRQAVQNENNLLEMNDIEAATEAYHFMNNY